MHFVTGGAFNGKSQWVKEYYKLNETPHQWISVYGGELPNLWTEKEAIYQQPFMVFDGIESVFKVWVQKYDVSDIRDMWRSFIDSWNEWEQNDPQRNVVIIGTDFSKGIVPLQALDRKWRDVTGWAYQDIVSVAERVEIVWYGIARQIK
ncbi:bifunctional adenosylcobinamide kinase/adenosylcobinamide-phosphate guanylyltransferase [Mesobacillus maritimus]|uniref:bifunctional adenosylcobinamide kinase/adenosylcobinamide-phosphate guanylyltransferase n=1 Tax=Mesobacillus maritimus TaxID=1643336 RepID=UPI00203DB883|nr:bifunctional adenosylcobinamide kinase/adenosylcobinamide-phosphate guanylyltransferase [Mesobacillus maritimus]MCM3584417.1 bifunctional adenosylcobinamide kinase/adenosylcobinamide-phosphate guanylyltransferase [Mesobacillus maritimus]